MTLNSSKMLIETQFGFLTNVVCSCYEFNINFFGLFVVAVVVQKHVKALIVSFKKGGCWYDCCTWSAVLRMRICVCVRCRVSMTDSQNKDCLLCLPLFMFVFIPAGQHEKQLSVTSRPYLWN